MTRRIRVRHVSSGERLGGCVMTRHDSTPLQNYQLSVEPRSASTSHDYACLLGVSRSPSATDLLGRPARASAPTALHAGPQRRCH